MFRGRSASLFYYGRNGSQRTKPTSIPSRFADAPRPSFIIEIISGRERNLLQHNHVSRTLRVPLLLWKYIWRARDEFEGFLGQRKRLLTKYKTRRTGKIENPEKSSLKRPSGAEIFVFLFTNRRVLIINKPILNEIQSVIEWLYYHSGHIFCFRGNVRHPHPFGFMDPVYWSASFFHVIF